MTNKGILRIVDANFNRCKEGLRVIEDIYRFMLEDDSARKRIRKIRHSLDEVANEKVLKDAILSRDSKGDLGKDVDVLEIKRKDSCDILYINFQRVKESLRVLEEFFKLICPRKVEHIKKLRYRVYTAEKDALRG
ncbi:MAG: thiamine-phosphate pyrophosphorylase [Candidatus Omnitrophota bacterium]|nr:MAG: thiamine-phosphate pyrophosphorylase [Candidatus Omnitrophota bacterium]